jgi:two-component system response regulator DesR
MDHDSVAPGRGKDHSAASHRLQVPVNDRERQGGAVVIQTAVVGPDRVPYGDLSVLLKSHWDIKIVAQVGFDPERTSEVASAVTSAGATVVVLNTGYMVSQVLPLVADIKAQNRQAGVLMLVDPEKLGMLPTRRRSAELSFLDRTASAALIADTIRRIATGERVVQPRLELAVLAGNRRASTRELEVLGLAAEGSSVAEIATRLRLARGTVRNYLSAVITNTGARNRIDAIRIARRDGWLH